MNLIFDLDGTIVDIAHKYYAVYTAFIGQYHGVALMPQQYWSLRRSNASLDDILHASNLSIISPEIFRDHTKSLIEKEAFLRLDILFHGAGEFLKNVSTRYRCCLVTMRRNPTMLEQQLRWLGIRDYFHDILTPMLSHGNADKRQETPKSEALRALALKGPTIMIGDSTMDMITGRELGFTTCAVTTGMHNRQVLEKLAPDFILDKLEDVLKVIENIT